jgi:hypothetical protein
MVSDLSISTIAASLTLVPIGLEYRLLPSAFSLVGNRTKTSESIFNDEFRRRLHALRSPRFQVQHAHLINQSNALRFRP